MSANFTCGDCGKCSEDPTCVPCHEALRTEIEVLRQAVAAANARIDALKKHVDGIQGFDYRLLG